MAKDTQGYDISTEMIAFLGIKHTEHIRTFAILGEDGKYYELDDVLGATFRLLSVMRENLKK